MRRLKESILLSVIVISSFLLTATTPVALAAKGRVRVYIICLPNVGGWEEWGEAGFQRLMSHISKGDVTCESPDSETDFSIKFF